MSYLLCGCETSGIRERIPLEVVGTKSTTIGRCAGPFSILPGGQNLSRKSVTQSRTSTLALSATKGKFFAGNNCAEELKTLSMIGTASDTSFYFKSEEAGKFDLLVDDGPGPYPPAKIQIKVASPGEIDIDFGASGKSIVSLGASWDRADALILQPNGKVIVAGHTFAGATSDFAIARLTINGALDTTFGSEGKSTTDISSGDDYVRAMGTQPDRKIIAGGEAMNAGNINFALVRYDSRGILDTTFGTEGKVNLDFSGRNDYLTSLVVSPDGAILSSGYAYSSEQSDFVLAKFLPNGSLDATFGSQGKVTTPFGAGNDVLNAMAIHDGKIIVAGYTVNAAGTSDFAVARYDAAGSLDSSFATGGKWTADFGSNLTDAATGVAIKSDGKIVVAGYAQVGASTDFALVQLTPSGQIDTQFGNNGRVSIDIGTGTNDHLKSVAVTDGKILLAGYYFKDTQNFYDFAVVRLNFDGTIDSSFASGSKYLIDFGNNNDFANALVLDSSGNAILAGGAYTATNQFDFALTKFFY